MKCTYMYTLKYTVRVLQTSLDNCDVSLLDNMFRTPLHWAAVLGNSFCLTEYYQYVHPIQEVLCVRKYCAFVYETTLGNPHEIVSPGHTSIVKMLLDRNADFTSSDANGATPLHYAAQNNFAGSWRIGDDKVHVRHMLPREFSFSLPDGKLLFSILLNM